jgi:hypothetical protein
MRSMSSVEIRSWLLAKCWITATARECAHMI